MIYVSGGQSTVARMSRTINTLSKTIRHNVEQYNAIKCVEDGLPATIMYEQAIDLENSIWNSISARPVMPHHTSNKCREIAQMMARASEETKLLKEEMKNIIAYRLDEHDTIREVFIANTGINKTDDGIRAMLACMGYKLETVIGDLIGGFSQYLSIDISLVPSIFSQYFEDSITKSMAANIHRENADCDEDYAMSSDEEDVVH